MVSRTISKGRHDYGAEYKLKISPDMVGPQVDEKWWSGIVENKKEQDEIDGLMKDIKSRKRSPFFPRSLLRTSSMLKKYGLDL